MRRPRKNRAKSRRNAPERRAALALAIAEGSSVVAAARKAGVGTRTAFRWLREDAFKDRVEELRDMLTSATIDAMVSAGVEAAETLRKLMRSENDPAVRLGAARTLLSSLLSYRQHAEFNARIAKLESERHAEPGSPTE
jgi:transposase-like protein